MNAASWPAVLVGKTDFPLRQTQPTSLQLPVTRSRQTDWELLDGPPYANGALHLGHVLNKLLKDVSVRAHAASGYAVAWTPRWDCHGLPVELHVERAGVDRQQPEAFMAAARRYAQSQMEGQRATFETLGVTADWSASTPTMDPRQQAQTLRVLADLVDRQALVMRDQPTAWCPACQSTLAGAEQEPLTVARTEAVVPFLLADGDVLLSWTTTPWTLPYHAGLVVNPDANYLQVTHQKQRAWVSEEAWPWVAQRYPEACPTGLTRSGREWVGFPYVTLWGSTHRVVSDARVQSGGGTGVLHAVPAFDLLDADVGQAHGWGTTQALATDGRLAGPGAWPFHRDTLAGEPANTATLAQLAQNPCAEPWLQAWTVTTEVPGCWRHRLPVLTRPSRQAFLMLSPEVRHRAQVMVEGMRFTPAMAQKRMLSLMAQRPDWCVSRQRTWGVPMALFLDRATGQPHRLAATVMRRVADAVATQGVETWWTTPHHAWLDGVVDPSEVEAVEDVLDVWFDSGALGVHAGPADLVVEGHDQLRGWFQACVWLSSLLERPAPFAQVVTHGFVVDEHGQKLSKSQGGDRHGRSADTPPAWSSLPADVLRWWALLGDTGADRPWAAPAVQAAQAAYAKARGTLRFALANVPTEQWGKTWSLEDAPALDRQDVLDAHKLQERVLTHWREGDFESGARQFLTWMDVTLSRQLYGRLKDRLYCAPAASSARRAAVATLQAVGEVLVNLLAVACPQLVAEALQTHPRLLERSSETRMPTVSTLWSEEARGVAQTLHQTWEKMGHKGGLERARLVLDGALPWTRWEVEEGLGVGQWQRQGTPDENEGSAVATPWGTGWLSASPDPLCPRCRRAAVLTEAGVCAVCREAHPKALTWRE